MNKPDLSTPEEREDYFYNLLKEEGERLIPNLSVPRHAKGVPSFLQKTISRLRSMISTMKQEN